MDNVPTLDPLDPQAVAEHLHIPLEQAEVMAEQHRLAAELSAADPSLGITALIIAGDRVSAKRWHADAEAGKVPWETSVHLTGSYARFDAAVLAVEEGHLSPAWLAANIANLWSFADPDDTNPRFLAAWKAAFAANGGTLFDPESERPNELPAGDPITVYRGQDRGAPVGFAFTTDLAIAKKFAAGAGLRQSHRNGVVLVATVPRDRVLAYLTGRGESETVVDPADLTYLEEPVDGALQSALAEANEAAARAYEETRRARRAKSAAWRKRVGKS